MVNIGLSTYFDALPLFLGIGGVLVDGTAASTASEDAVGAAGGGIAANLALRLVLTPEDVDGVGVGDEGVESVGGEDIGTVGCEGVDSMGDEGVGTVGCWNKGNVGNDCVGTVGGKLDVDALKLELVASQLVNLFDSFRYFLCILGFLGI